MSTAASPAASTASCTRRAEPPCRWTNRAARRVAAHALVPGITFWQTAVDLVFANNVPSGHGPGWTTADTVRLRALLDARPR